MSIISLSSLGSESVMRLADDGFPLQELNRHPVSAVELCSTRTDAGLRGVCTQSCLGCCASSEDFNRMQGLPASMTPRLMQQILDLFDKFYAAGVLAFSRERLSLCSGSNELDHASCWDVRLMLSEFIEQKHGTPLGGMASNIAFHISRCSRFCSNLAHALDKSRHWNRICMSIDEQVPFHDRADYESYLDVLAWVWKCIVPALRCELDDAQCADRRRARVVLNLVVPQRDNFFLDKHTELYPGGPKRAIDFEELVARYVTPFVGQLSPRELARAGAISSMEACLVSIPDSLLIISMANFELVGRARSFIGGPAEEVTTTREYSCIRTKIHPVGESRFIIQPSLVPVGWSDSEGDWRDQREVPRWVTEMRSCLFDVTEVAAG